MERERGTDILLSKLRLLSKFTLSTLISLSKFKLLSKLTLYKFKLLEKIKVYRQAVRPLFSYSLTYTWLPF